SRAAIPLPRCRGVSNRASACSKATSWIHSTRAAGSSMTQAAPAPAAAAHPLGESHEARFLEDLKSFDPSVRDKGVIRLHLSRLEPDNRDKQNLRNAETAFDELTRTRSAFVYRLRNSDLMVIYERHENDAAERAVLKLLKLWERDALMQKFKN